MQYYVLSQDGQKYGPGDVVTLQLWVNENRVLPDTLLEETGSGMKIAASSLPGLQFGFHGATPISTLPSNQQSHPAPLYGPGSLPQSSCQQRPSMYQPYQSEMNNTGYIVGAIICAVLSLGFFPVIFGPAAIFLSYKVKTRGDVITGSILMAVSAVTMVLGVVIGAVIGFEAATSYMNSTR